MTTDQINFVWKVIAGILSGIVLIITAVKLSKNTFKEYNDVRRLNFAKKQQPVCQTICSAPKYMYEISQALIEIKTQNDITREIALETLGSLMIQKCNEACEKGFMEQSEKDNLIHSFIPYDLGNGNGKVLNHVSQAMNQPTHLGGPVCDVDMSAIIERERERYALKHNK